MKLNATLILIVLVEAMTGALASVRGGARVRHDDVNKEGNAPRRLMQSKSMEKSGSSEESEEIVPSTIPPETESPSEVTTDPPETSDPTDEAQGGAFVTDPPETSNPTDDPPSTGGGERSCSEPFNPGYGNAPHLEPCQVDSDCSYGCCLYPYCRCSYPNPYVPQVTCLDPDFQPVGNPGGGRRFVRHLQFF